MTFRWQEFDNSDCLYITETEEEVIEELGEIGAKADPSYQDTKRSTLAPLQGKTYSSSYMRVLFYHNR